MTGHSLGAAIATVTMGLALFGECTTLASGEIFKTPRSAPATCPTLSLAYLLPGAAGDERDRGEVLRLGNGATEALDDNRTTLPSVVDHSMLNYIPLLERLVSAN